MWISIVIIFLVTYYQNRLDKVHVVQFLILVRNVMPFLDLEQRRKNMDKGFILIFITMQFVGSILLQVFFNFISKPMYIIPSTTILGLVACIGTFRMIYDEEGDLHVILIEKNRIYSMISMYFGGVMSLLCIQFII